jgi:predicted transcriptional regulator
MPDDPITPTEFEQNQQRMIRTVHIKGDVNRLPVVSEGRPPVLVPGQEKKGMYHPDGSFNTEGLLEILGSDIRRKILSKLAKFPRYASDLAVDLGVTKQAIKKHLNKLMEFGLVEEVDVAGADQKILYYQLTVDLAVSLKIDITPNYFSIKAENTPDDLAKYMHILSQDPRMALVERKYDRSNYSSLDPILKALGLELMKVEDALDEAEQTRRNIFLQKTALLNRMQMIINLFVENDLEKEILQSIFFDVNASVEGLTLENIFERLFLRRKNRAGQRKRDLMDEDKDGADEEFEDRSGEREVKMKERARKILDLLKLLVKNMGFIRTEGSKIMFDFAEKEEF